MRIGVTGATGFVGRAFASCEPADANAEILRLSRRGGSGAVEIGDLGDVGEITLPPLDALVHLAALTHSGVGNGGEAMEAYRSVNVRGTAKLLTAAARAGMKHFVLVSSIKVNGERTLPGQAFTAADTPAPEDAYGRSKLEAEEAVRAFCEDHGIAWTIVRPPLVYGTDATANFAMLRRLALGLLPVPFGGFTAPRSFIFVDNLADFIWTVLRNPAARNRTFVVSDGEDLGVRDLVRRLGKAAGREPAMFTVPEPLLDLAMRIPGLRGRLSKLSGRLQIDASSARDILGWRPPFAVDEALRQTVAGR